MAAEPDKWRFHTGVTTPTDRRRLLRLMWRRAWWTARHHGWRTELGKLTAGGFVIGAVLAVLGVWPPRPLIVLVTGVLMAVFAAVLFLPLRLVVLLVWWRRLTGRSPRWVTHWCEGPHDALAVRFTRPEPAAASIRPRWYGMDLFAQHHAGKRLIGWLQLRADEQGAVLIIRTTQPPLESYYRRAGMTVVRQPRLRCGAVQLGASVLCYPADGRPDTRPGKQRLLHRRAR